MAGQRHAMEKKEEVNKLASPYFQQKHTEIEGPLNPLHVTLHKSIIRALS